MGQESKQLVDWWSRDLKKKKNEDAEINSIKPWSCRDLDTFSPLKIVDMPKSHGDICRRSRFVKTITKMPHQNKDNYLQINHSKILSFWVNHKSVLILKEINLKWNSVLETTVYRGALSFYTHFSRRQNSWEILPQEHLRIIWLNYFESFF